MIMSRDIAALDWWTDIPDSPGPDQDEYILMAHQSGLVDHVWRELDLGLCTVHVSAYAAKIGDRRLRYSALLQQRAADMIGGHLLTPALVDAIWIQAQIRLDPKPLNDGHGGPAPDMARVSSWYRHDRLVDAELARFGSVTDMCLVASEGKDWVVTDRIWQRPRQAANYGWLTSAGHAIQGVGLAHDPSHSDYSQLGRWVRSDCLLPEGHALVADVLAGHYGADVQRMIGGPLPSARPPWAPRLPLGEAIAQGMIEPCPDTERGT